MNPGDRLTLHEAVKLVASRVDYKEWEDARSKENRISHRVRYAVKTGKLQQEKDGSFTLANLVRWASTKQPERFEDFLIGPIGNSSQTIPSVTGTAFSFPSSIEECHAALLAAEQRIASLQKEIADLKPDAERYRENCKTLKKNARQGRNK